MCESISGPYYVYIDFCTAVVSKTQPEMKLMHGSVPTALNEKRRIETADDLDELMNEFNGTNLYSEIILKHNQIRTPDGDSIISSDLKIRSLLTVFIYILLDTYQ